MDIKSAVEYVSVRFKYRADKNIILGDTWGVMPEQDEEMTGDCDDFAITCIWLACGRNIWKFVLYVFILHRYRFYHATTRTGEPHIIGFADGLWFDNWSLAAMPQYEFFQLTRHKKRFPYPSPIVMYYMVVGWASRVIRSQ
jgi:hypothetical protein